MAERTLVVEATITLGRSIVVGGDYHMGGYLSSDSDGIRFVVGDRYDIVIGDDEYDYVECVTMPDSYEGFGNPWIFCHEWPNGTVVEDNGIPYFISNTYEEGVVICLPDDYEPTSGLHVAIYTSAGPAETPMSHLTVGGTTYEIVDATARASGGGADFYATEGEAGYIANMPMGVTGYGTLFDGEITFEHQGAAAYGMSSRAVCNGVAFASGLIEGVAYSVEFDGAEYELTYANGLGNSAINEYAINYVDGDLKFFVYQSPEDNSVHKIVALDDYSDMTVSLKISGILGVRRALPVNSVFLGGRLIEMGTGVGADVLNHTGGNTASGSLSHAEGRQTTASGTYAHAEGNEASATGSSAHAEGSRSTASGGGAHAEGYNTEASGGNSHAEGYEAKASDECSHAEGEYTNATGEGSHAEGHYTTASGMYSHAEGCGHIYTSNTNTWASGRGSHAEGIETQVSGEASHAEGIGTIADGKNQHVFGRYNVADTTSLEIVGKGNNKSSRSNARTLDASGNEWLAGNVTAAGGTLTIGSTSMSEAQLKALLALLS